MPTKEDIQPLIDEQVECYRNRKTITCFWGIPIEELTHEELCAALSQVVAERDRAVQLAVNKQERDSRPIAGRGRPY